LDAIRLPQFPTPSRRPSSLRRCLPNRLHAYESAHSSMPPRPRRCAMEPRCNAPPPSGPCQHRASPTASTTVTVATTPGNDSVSSTVTTARSMPHGHHYHTWELHHPPGFHCRWVHTATSLTASTTISLQQFAALT
jgi:hypothetical protein